MDSDLGAKAVTYVVAAEGRLVGRTRFQKTVYLLQKLGLSLPFEFEYHHYGPYSQELAEVIDASVETGEMDEDFGVGYHSTKYSIFSTDAEPPPKIADVPTEDVKGWLSVLGEYTGTDLEIGSTILYLRDEQGIVEGELENEVMELKPQKATPERLARAWHLLRRLDLAPPETL